MTREWKRRAHAWGCDVCAGMAMAFSLLPGLILVPLLLSESGMDFKGAFAAYVLFSMAGTLLCGLLRLPLAAGTSLALTYYLVYLGSIAGGLTWNQLLGVSLVVSITGALLFLSPLGKYFLRAIPTPVRDVLPAGIGLLLIWAGLVEGHIFLASPWSVTMLGDFQDPLAYLSLIGIVLTLGLLARKFAIALALGGIVTALITWNEGFWEVPTVWSVPPQGLDKVAGFLDVWAVSDAQVPLLFGTALTLLLCLSSIHAATLAAADENRQRQATALFFVLSAVGSVVGTLPLTAAPASLPGGRLAPSARRAAVVAALLLLWAWYLEPLLAAMADFPAMTVPVLVGGGVLLVAQSASRLRISQLDAGQLVPALCVLLILPLSFNLAAGIGAGIISYVLLQLCEGHWRQLPVGTGLLAVIYLLYFVYGTI